MLKLKAKEFIVTVNPRGNWNTAKNYFPTIEVDQVKGIVSITRYCTDGYQKKASVSTTECSVSISKDKQSMFVRGAVDCQNWQNHKCSGEQKFCFAIFVGDSGHIYTHRAVASKGWMEADPIEIKKRLRKLGIGADARVIQQGDFLLKPANGSSLPLDQLKHEWTSASHHKFSEPLLSEYVPGVGRIIYIPDGKIVELHHEAVDGIQHPMVVVPAGQWVIGTTANSLSHSNKRD